MLRNYAKSRYALRKYFVSGAATTLRQFVGRESSYLLLLFCYRDEAVITIPASYTCKCSYTVCSKLLQIYDNIDNNCTKNADFVKGIINRFRHLPLQFLRVRFPGASTCVHPSSGVGVLPLRVFLQNLLV